MAVSKFQSLIPIWYHDFARWAACSPVHRKRVKQQGVVEGLAFKQALFGVWLSNNPADKDLKRAMLLAKGDGGQTALK